MSRVNNCEYEDTGGRSGALKSVHVAMLLCVMEENVAAALPLQICNNNKKKKSRHCFVKCRQTHLEKREQRRLCKKKCDFSSEEAEVLLVLTSARFVFPAVTTALKHLPPPSPVGFFFISIRFCCWTTWLAGGPAPRLCFSGVTFDLASLPHSELCLLLFGGLHVRR